MNPELSTFASVPSQIKENLIFIDSTVENYQGLISSTDSDSQVVILDPFSDGISQISAELANYDNVASIHLVSHGEPGNIQLGNTELNLDTFEGYADELKGWSNVLTEEADILFYGCNIGANQDGETLLNQIKEITDADLAASTNLTGNSALGGDWEWEINTGTIESKLAFATEAIDDYDGVLASSAMMMNHSNALMDLVPSSDATHVAINNGGWFNPNTWENGQIPDDGADILIPQGRRVFYNQESDARLDTLRVDGVLNFATGRDTKMLIDTFVVSSQGKLRIGNANNPIRENRKAEIIFTSDTPVDTQSDTQQLGRGLISQGQVEIHGADKLDFVSLSQDVNAGENELILDLPSGMSEPLGWQVGDQLVLGGTEHRFDGNDENNSRFQDEVLSITAIEGNRISFTNNDITSGDNTVLRFDHERPEGLTEENLQLYIANTTRNITFETENGEDVPIDHRGHVMFMHNPNVKVNNAGFYNLGRTDKSKLVDDPERNVDGTSGSGINPRGRYALHFHRTGAEDPSSTPSLAKGNAIVDSPGWGIVHHDSHAVLEDNVVFDVAGAGIAAESGNEIGAWRNNLTIKTTGDGQNGFIPTNTARERRFDFGFKGEGYWVQGAAQVEMTDNVAISAAGGAMSVFAASSFSPSIFRDQPTFPVSNLPEPLQSIASNGEESIDVTNLPLRSFSGFESYNSMAGIVFWHHMANTDGQLEFNGPGLNPAHDFRSVVDDFKLWNIIAEGVHFQYVTQMDLVDGLIVGDVNQPSAIGIRNNDASQNHLYQNLRIEGFEQGIQINGEGDNDRSRPFLSSRLENSYLANNTVNLAKNDQLVEFKVPVEYFEIDNTQFETTRPNQAPTAQFNHQSVGGLAVNFDGSNSNDGDAPNDLKSTGNEIASWGWDLDNNGTVDKYGRQIEHYFDAAGSYQVNLTVWDSQGATDTVAQTINVTSTEYGNLLIDGGFDSSAPFGRQPYRVDSVRAGEGWIASKWKKSSDDGAAVVSDKTFGIGLGQIVLDNSIRRGTQTLSLDLKNIEGATNANQIEISVWGVDGQFNAGNIASAQPKQVGALGMNAVNLLSEKVGGSTLDWTTFDWDLNFGDGYQYVLFDIAVKGVDSSKGDLVAIDNVEIK